MKVFINIPILIQLLSLFSITVAIIFLLILIILYQYCQPQQAVDQGLHSKLVCSTYKYIPRINIIVDDDDLYCCAVECIDQGLHTELVCNCF